MKYPVGTVLQGAISIGNNAICAHQSMQAKLSWDNFAAMCCEPLRRESG